MAGKFDASKMVAVSSFEKLSHEKLSEVQELIGIADANLGRLDVPEGREIITACSLLAIAKSLAFVNETAYYTEAKK